MADSLIFKIYVYNIWSEFPLFLFFMLKINMKCYNKEYFNIPEDTVINNPVVPIVSVPEKYGETFKIFLWIILTFQEHLLNTYNVESTVIIFTTIWFISM